MLIKIQIILSYHINLKNTPGEKLKDILNIYIIPFLCSVEVIKPLIVPANGDSIMTI